MKGLLLGVPVVAAAVVAWSLGAPEAQRSEIAVAASVEAPLRAEPIQPIPLRAEVADDRTALGERLFHDARLSRDDTVSCASCHALELGGTDRRAKSLGVGGTLGEVNAPTVFNTAFNFKQFWDGRADTLEEQAAGPIHNPKEMATDWKAVIAKIRRDPSYAEAFGAAYPDGINQRNVVDAIVTFERSLITPNSRFDRWLRGEETAIDEEEKEGYRLFKSYGCVACHQGVNVGGNMLETFGVMADYFAERGNVTEVDYGRYNVTKRAEDRHVFKVPSLRLAALTPPYFHDGSAKRLEDAVRVMARYQLGRRLTDVDTARIAAFLRTLPGEFRGRPLLAALGPPAG